MAEVAQVLSPPARADGRPSIMCSILTTGVDHAYLKPALNTWCLACDACVIFSNVTASGADHEWPLELNGAVRVGLREPCRNLAKKEELRQLWTARHADGFAFYYHADDDTFACVANLRSFLSAFNPREHHFLGRRIGGPTAAHHAGSSGFILSARTQATLGPAFARGGPCVVPAGYNFPGDTHLAGCLRTSVGVRASETRVAPGRERFLAFERSRVRMARSGDATVVHEFCADPDRLAFGECGCAAADTEIGHPRGFPRGLSPSPARSVGAPMVHGNRASFGRADSNAMLAWFCGLPGNTDSPPCLVSRMRERMKESAAAGRPRGNATWWRDARDEGFKQRHSAARKEMHEGWCAMPSNRETLLCQSWRDPSVCPF